MIIQIKLNNVERCRVCPRPELKDDIEQRGIHEPIIVELLDSGTYRVLDGKQRATIAWDMGDTDIKAVVIKPGASAIQIVEEHDLDLFREKVKLSLGTGYVVSSTNCSILGEEYDYASHWQAILVKREFIA